jgi:hypothetical protein
MSDTWDAASLPTGWLGAGGDPAPALGTSDGAAAANGAGAAAAAAAAVRGAGGGGGGACATAGGGCGGGGVVDRRSGGGSGGMYKCAALYPPAKQSLRMGRKNLHLFR